MLSFSEKTHTLDDLCNWHATGTSLAVIGHPVEHSLSPRMHNAALSALAEDDARFSDWQYYKFDIPPERLCDALPLFHKKGFRGLNLTVPHKVNVLKEGLAKPDSKSVVNMGAANTLKWHAEGYIAYNTDGFGMSRAIGEHLCVGNAMPLQGVSVVLLGAGGAARAAAFQCLREDCRELWIGNRNQERLADLLADLNDSRVRGFDITQEQAFMPSEPLLINATSVGLREEDPAAFSLAGRSESWRVFDMVYSPAETALLRQARNRGFPAVNGLPMLVWQGALALAIWTNDHFENALTHAPIFAEDMGQALAL